MTVTYKIHPAIGIARVGDSPAGFFLGPELPGGPRVEIGPAGETPLQQFKDPDTFRLKRQAARFRVFAYDGDRVIREITANEAQIEWTVRIANRKAAATQFDGDQPRNPGIAVDQLSITPKEKTISGAGQPAALLDDGLFMGSPVYLGEVRTDAHGRLIVLGGRGVSSSVPPNQDIVDFANNPGWHDDVGDGPVQARITLPGAEPVSAEGAWVIVAPPDFAPEIGGVVTLYDVCFQAAVTRGWIPAPSATSFVNDIYPMLLRASRIRFVNQFAQWDLIPRHWSHLSDAGAAAADDRGKVYTFITNPPLRQLELTEVQKAHLVRWRDGRHANDWPPYAPQAVITPDGLDKASLDECAGGGFYPGIEAGVAMSNPALYQSKFRIDQSKSLAGDLTMNMACPWQADFYDCRGRWWPEQRPDNAMLDVNDPQPAALWARGIGGYTDMVQSFYKLGFVRPSVNATGTEVFIETERTPGF